MLVTTVPQVHNALELTLTDFDPDAPGYGKVTAFDCEWQEHSQEEPCSGKEPKPLLDAERPSSVENAGILGLISELATLFLRHVEQWIGANQRWLYVGKIMNFAAHPALM